ncbi:MAG: hypothetical protein KF799_08515 [Bdellovibrionales bacterium]|nr:hypothetical protein [Bdellovibrionales bacterium]
MAQDEVLWLIKSSGRILGPFRSEKVGELLRTREISVLDEISPPMRRWQTIQYHEEFRPVVDSLRKANLSERTEATWTPNSTQLTQTLTEVEGAGELTEEITDIDGFSATGKEIVVHNVQEQSHASHTQSGGRYQAAQGQNTAIQRQVEKTTRGLWIITVLILVAAAAFIFQRRMSTGAFDIKPTATSLKQTVIGHIQAGRYSEALRDLKSYYSDPLQSGDLAIYYGGLLVHLEGQTLLGRRLFNTVLATKRPEVKQAYTGLGVADLMDGQLDSAQENFDRALNLDPEYVPAIVNLAAVSLQKGDYAGAKQKAFRALRLNPAQGEALLILAEAQLYLFKRSANPNELVQISRLLSDFRLRSWDFAGEMDFYQLYFDFLRRTSGLEEKLRAYLDSDPRLTADHRHNLFIYRGRTQWKILARFCEQMAEKMSEEPRVSAFLASCYAREARWDSARRSIEKAVHQSPKDPLIQAWYSYVLRESGDADQASVVLGSATQANRNGEYVLPVLMQARFCQQTGMSQCARSNWQKIYENNMDYLPAVAGMAWANADIKSNNEAAKLMNKGLRLSPEYIPLLELRQKAESEGWYAGN